MVTRSHLRLCGCHETCGLSVLYCHYRCLWTITTYMGRVYSHWPTREIIAALALFFDLRGSLAVIAALLMFFIVILAYGAWMGFDLNCGCFKFGESSVSTKGSLRPAILRDAVMLGAVCYLYYLRFKKPVHPFGFKALPRKILILRR